jgi:hypothetical protein
MCLTGRSAPHLGGNSGQEFAPFGFPGSRSRGGAARHGAL